FGDEAVTGKPAGDDLREGKLTVLIANAMAGSGEEAAARLDALLGRELSDAEVAEARALIVASGAREAAEAEIEAASGEARAALVGLGDLASRGLDALVDLATRRDA
ncbi:MAG: polyprenyl synthetase family protein, partial [Actinobacteria bacterium]|nr:polyprenyl synthetase family protein [Actinomycetota bacterium]